MAQDALPLIAQGQVPADNQIGLLHVRKTLSLLVQEAGSRGVTAVSLEATAMGRPLYEQVVQGRLFKSQVHVLSSGPDEWL